MKICPEDGFTEHQGPPVKTCRYPLLTRSEMGILSAGAWLIEAIPEKLVNAVHDALSAFPSQGRKLLLFPRAGVRFCRPAKTVTAYH